MGVKKTSRLLAVMVALVMVMTSVAGVFAASYDNPSSAAGTNQSNKTVANMNKGTLTVTTSGDSIESSKGTVKGNKISGLKDGNLIVITSDEGKTYRWFKKAKGLKVKSSKLSWTKVKGASYYVLKINRGGKTIYKKVSKNSFKCKKGDKVWVRAIKKSGGNTYTGVWSSKKTIK